MRFAYHSLGKTKKKNLKRECVYFNTSIVPLLFIVVLFDRRWPWVWTLIDTD